MGVSYKKLWKLLIDRELKKGDLRRLTGISPQVMAKLAKNENVNVDTLVKICLALKCGVEDILEITPE